MNSSDYIPDDTGPWWDVILIFLPPTITTQRCKIEYIDWYGEQRTVRVSLTLKEYEMIKPAEDDSFSDEQPVA